MTATSAVDRFLSRLGRLEDPAVFISTRSPGDLRRRAAAVDGDPGDLPLRGTVFAVKDNIDVAGLPTTAGCPAFAYEPDASAAAVDLLERAGAIAVGKTNLDQFATGLVGTRSPYGTPANPFDPSLVPGGSSSGSAVAVALELVDFALGTDTAGSGRVPAACCGIFGYKPTRGLIPDGGVVPAVRSIDCVSIFAADLRTIARVAPVVEVYDPDNPWSRRPSSASPAGSASRIGVVDVASLDALGCSAQTATTYQSVVDALDTSSVTVDLAPFLELGDELYGGPWVAERTAAVGDFVRDHRHECDPVVAAIVDGGRSWTAVDQHRASYRRVELVHAIEQTFREVDAIILPTIPTIPTVSAVADDPVGTNTRLGRFTTFSNLADLCAVTVPIHRDDGSGPPGSVTVHAPAWGDRRALDLAAAITSEALDAGPTPAGIRLVVAGAHLRGQPLEHQLTDLGATWESTTTTAPTYRLYALADATPPKPGLVWDPTGTAIEVDTWLVSSAGLGTFLTMVPPPLTLGTVTLADGSPATGFLCEPRALIDAVDVTEHGGWRAYRASSSG